MNLIDYCMELMRYSNVAKEIWSKEHHKCIVMAFIYEHTVWKDGRGGNWKMTYELKI
jgi:hypothetical protein